MLRNAVRAYVALDRSRFVVSSERSADALRHKHVIHRRRRLKTSCAEHDATRCHDSAGRACRMMARGAAVTPDSATAGRCRHAPGGTPRSLGGAYAPWTMPTNGRGAHLSLGFEEAPEVARSGRLVVLVNQALAEPVDLQREVERHIRLRDQQLLHLSAVRR